MKSRPDAPGGVVVERCTVRDLDVWVPLRCRLWPESGEDEHRADAQMLLCRDAIVLIARDPHAGAVGFAEAMLRQDYVNGCSTSPVAFLEGIYVLPEWRGRGVARRMCAAVERWAVAMGCAEFASDALVDNVDSHRMHAALGLEETERVVYFRKSLKP